MPARFRALGELPEGTPGRALFELGEMRIAGQLAGDRIAAGDVSCRGDGA